MAVTVVVVVGMEEEEGTLTSHWRSCLSVMSGRQLSCSQFMSLREFWAAQGCRQRSTTTESAFAGMNPSTNTFLEHT